MKFVRRLPLQGLHNARDLGGFPTQGGGATRFGVFVRAEAPCQLPEADLTALREYGVTASIDLRSTFEVNQRPSDLAQWPGYHHKPLFHEGVVYDPKDGSAKPAQDAPPPPPVNAGQHDWGQMYRSMAEEARQWAVEVLALAAENEGALLYHCTTGKDRTGLLTCYLLSIAGVAREDIVADYCVSQVFLQPVYRQMIQRAGGVFGDDLSSPFFQTPAAAMDSLLDYLDETYGGVLPFLRQAGVGEDTFARIRAKFLAD